MANPEHVAVIHRGVDAWNEWRHPTPYSWPVADLSLADLRGLVLSRQGPTSANLSYVDLHGADLQGADLRGVDFHGVDLRDANLQGANLFDADFTVADLPGANLCEAIVGRANFLQADLRGTDLKRANLRGAVLQLAKLQGADLQEADLSLAKLGSANLRGANLTRAWFDETVFGNTDLTDAQGLETCIYHGPSTIDHRTLGRSGRLPLAFLRGCGLPEVFIANLPSLLGHAIQFYSCFISYSAKDQEFADRLHADLQKQGVRCWFAPHDIQGGRKIHEKIDQAIRVYDRMLLILSENSMKSEWVKTEIAYGRQMEVNEKRQVLSRSAWCHSPGFASGSAPMPIPGKTQRGRFESTLFLSSATGRTRTRTGEPSSGY